MSKDNMLVLSMVIFSSIQNLLPSYVNLKELYDQEKFNKSKTVLHGWDVPNIGLKGGTGHGGARSKSGRKGTGAPRDFSSYNKKITKKSAKGSLDIKEMLKKVIKNNNNNNKGSQDEERKDSNLEFSKENDNNENTEDFIENDSEVSIEENNNIEEELLSLIHI